MKVAALDPPRVFVIGRGAPIALHDCGRIELAPDEQVTFVTPAGGEYDVVRKAWGFYATPSLNARLPSFGLRPALVKSCEERFYVMLVERGAEEEFARYLERERNVVLGWLDEAAALGRIAAALAPGERCPLDEGPLSLVHTFSAPPPGENAFRELAGRAYHRELRRCGSCGHFVSRSALGAAALYSAAYVEQLYGDDAGLRSRFERIVSLPPERSDNAGRVRRVVAYAHERMSPAAPPTILDVGSGLCVFLSGMRAASWACTALDPDPRAASHAREHVGVAAVCGDFMATEGLGRFDLVAFNKVLEHVVDPVAMLARAHGCLAPGGAVYLELPDGEAALDAGPDREEFYIEHLHAFSLASTSLLAIRAGFRIDALERLREPSGKYTLRAFLRPLPEATR
jgi:SAM-dependent methyltransferase